MRDPKCPRERISVFPTEVGKIGSKSYVYDVSRDSLLVSSLNFRLPNGAWSGGGPFYVRKYSRTHGPKMSISWSKLGSPWIGTVKGVGPCPAGSTVPIPPTFESESADLSGAWATGYARARPGNPVANLGQFLGELRDLPSIPLLGAYKGIRSLRGQHIRNYGREMYRRTVGYVNLGSEYLNVKFGWAPFVKDLQDLYLLWVTIDQRLAELVRNNGKSLRRKRVLENDTTSSQTRATYGWPYANVYGSPPWWPTGTSVVTTTTKTQRQVWWVGRFQYYVPDIGSSQWTKQARLALFGALPTPSVVYELLPWSWLIDWFSNVGDVVSNASSNAIDNQYLVLHYGYVMKHTLRSTEYRCDTFHTGKSESTPYGPTYWPPVHRSFVSTETLETKLRTGSGNPFGLGVKSWDLSPSQLAILAALGLSRAKVT